MATVIHRSIESTPLKRHAANGSSRIAEFWLVWVNPVKWRIVGSIALVVAATAAYNSMGIGEAASRILTALGVTPCGCLGSGH